MVIFALIFCETCFVCFLGSRRPGISQNSGTLKQSMWFEWITDGGCRLDLTDPPNKGCLLYDRKVLVGRIEGKNTTKRQHEDEKRTRVTSKLWHVFAVSLCWNTSDKTRIRSEITKIHWNTRLNLSFDIDFIWWPWITNNIFIWTFFYTWVCFPWWLCARLHKLNLKQVILLTNKWPCF